jgi:hypothetical protein
MTSASPELVLPSRHVQDADDAVELLQDHRMIGGQEKRWLRHGIGVQGHLIAGPELLDEPARGLNRGGCMAGVKAGFVYRQDKGAVHLLRRRRSVHRGRPIGRSTCSVRSGTSLDEVSRHHASVVSIELDAKILRAQSRNGLAVAIHDLDLDGHEFDRALEDGRLLILWCRKTYCGENDRDHALDQGSGHGRISPHQISETRTQI